MRAAAAPRPQQQYIAIERLFDVIAERHQMHAPQSQFVLREMSRVNHRLKINPSIALSGKQAVYKFSAKRPQFAGNEVAPGRRIQHPEIADPKTEISQKPPGV